MTEESQSTADLPTSLATLRTVKAPTTKTALVGKLLVRAKGATLAEIATEMSWQPHSCRAFLTGLRKKGAMLIKEERPDGSVAYRIVPTVADLSVS